MAKKARGQAAKPGPAATTACSACPETTDAGRPGVEGWLVSAGGKATCVRCRLLAVPVEHRTGLVRALCRALGVPVGPPDGGAEKSPKKGEPPCER